MKKAFSSFAVLLAGIMLLATSCTNPGQVTFTDGDNGSNLTEDGYSVATVKISSTPKYERTIFPNDWTEGNMKKLIYHLSAAPAQSEDSTGWTKVDPAATGVNFTYAQIIAGQATIDLDPGKWDFTLDVYQGDVSQIDSFNASISADKKVLTATKTDINLADGAQTVSFALVSAAGKAATGKATINIYFNKVADLDHIEVKCTDFSDVAVAMNKEQLGKAPAEKNGYCKITYQKDNIPAGPHKLEAVFYTLDDAKLLTHQEILIIDGENDSNKDIYIPKDAYGSKPAKATNLNATCEYAPADKLTMDEANKKFAQQSDTDSIVDDKYNLTLTWKDNAFNETGFKVSFNITSKAAAFSEEGAAVSYAYNAGGTLTKTGVSGTTVDKIKVLGDIDNSGILAPSTNSITFEIPTGVFCYNFVVTANNYLGDSASDPYLPTADTDAVGLFTITYDLQTPKSSGLGTFENAVVTYNNLNATSNKRYFVVAYPYSKTAGDATIQAKGAAGAYPYINGCDFNFSGWYFTGDKMNSAVNVTKVNDDALAGNGSGPFDFKNQNITVVGSWTTTATVDIKFPSYSGAKALLATDKLMGEALELKAGLNDGVITVPDPASGTIDAATVKFTIYAPNGTEVYTTGGAPKIGISGEEDPHKKITIKQTEFLADKTGGNDFVNPAGIYRVYVKFDYTDTAGAVFPIDGNLFVKLTNGTK